VTDLERDMLLQYCAEIEVRRLFKEGVISGTVHLSFGQEAVDVGVCAAYSNPMVYGNHRSHGQYLAATGDVRGLFEQILDNKTQHLHYPGKFQSNGVQGSLIPVAYGTALQFKRNGIDRRVLCFIGDGTLGQGVLYETLGLIMHDSVAMSIIVIDNGYQMSKTPTKPRLRQLAGAFGVRHMALSGSCGPDHIRDSQKVLGNDPALIHVKVDRLCGHSISDTEVYRPSFERDDSWRAEQSPVYEFMATPEHKKIQNFVWEIVDDVTRRN